MFTYLLTILKKKPMTSNYVELINDNNYCDSFLRV